MSRPRFRLYELGAWRNGCGQIDDGVMFLEGIGQRWPVKY